MSTVSSYPSIYRVGGSLPVNAPSYVKRQADEDLYLMLKQGEFCYVLNARQMGKSSLRVQTMVRLQEEGIACAALDLTAIGASDISREEWYAGVIDELVSSFNLYECFDLEAWWTRQGLLSPNQKLGKFFTEILLQKLRQKVVIFIDEIDSTLKLPFKDDFFALIRACYNKRVDNEDYNRLTFCLLGVASPDDLIENKQSTPFNIGKAIELAGFELTEVQPLTRGLQGIVDNPDEIMKGILTWTGGQPFLTQRLCNLLVNQGTFKPNLSELVTDNIIQNWESQDQQEHLKIIKNRILSNEGKVGGLLGLYRQILQNQDFSAQNNDEERTLLLSGLVVKRRGKLKVYNPIYARVFDENWIDEELSKLRPYAEHFRAWIASGKAETSWLLRGRILEEASEWANRKNLSDDDRDFLHKSELQQFKEKQEIKEKEDKLQQEVKKKEDKLQQEKNKRKIQGLIGSLITIVAITSTWAGNEWYNKRFCRGIGERVGQDCFRFIITNGDSQLFVGTNNDYLVKGIKNFDEKKFEKAEIDFKNANNSDPYDPISLIYANNARANQKKVSPYKVGVVVPVDTYEYVARNMLRGIAYAQNEFNENRKKDSEPLLEIFIANDKNDETIAKKIAKRLVKKDVLAVIGHRSSGSSLSAIGIYRKKMISMISPTAGSSELDNNDNFIRAVASNKDVAESFYRYTDDNCLSKNKKVWFIYDSNALYSQNFKNDFFDTFSDHKSKEKFYETPFEDLSGESESNQEQKNTAKDKIKELMKNKIDQEQVGCVILIPSTKTTFTAMSILNVKRGLPLNFSRKKIPTEINGR